MQTTVELQDMFSYSLIVPILIGLVFLSTFLFFLIRKMPKKVKEQVPVAKPAPIKNIPMIKAKYDTFLMDIERDYIAGGINEREAFQELSKAIRHFVYDVSGIQVQNYTLTEIGKAKLPGLYELISECYVPEFSEESKGNVRDAINKARKVIAQWN